MDYRVVLLSKTLHEQLLWDSRIPSESRIIAKPVLKREINNVDTFSFTVYKTHPLYDKLTPYNGWVAVKKNGKVKFIGKITQAPDNIRHEKQVQCEGGLALLKHSAYSRYMPNWCPKAYDKSVSKFSTTDSVEKMVNRVLDIHNAQVYEGTAEKWEDGFPCVRLGTCTARENPYGVDLVKSAGNEGTQNEGLYITRDQTSCTTPYDWLTSEVCEKCAAYAIMEVGDDYSLTLNIYGAKELPANTTTPIRFEKNLLDMSLDVDFSDVCTVFLPLGESNSNVGTLLGNDIPVTYTSGIESITEDMSLGKILENVLTGKLLTDNISETIDDSIAAASTEIDSETHYNTIEMDGTSEDAAEDYATMYTITAAYENRPNKNFELVKTVENSACGITYYRKNNDRVVDSYTYFMTYADGWANPAEDWLPISETEQEGYYKIRYQQLIVIKNGYLETFTNGQGGGNELKQKLEDSSFESYFEVWRPVYAQKNSDWICTNKWKRTFSVDVTGLTTTVRVTISDVPGSEMPSAMNYVPGVVTDFSNYTHPTNPGTKKESTYRSKAKDGYVGDFLKSSSTVPAFCVAGTFKEKTHGGTTPSIVTFTSSLASGSTWPADVSNCLWRLPSMMNATLSISELEITENISDHMGVVNVGSSGLGWVVDVDNHDVVSDVSVDGVTIRANYPYLEWVEGIEKYGRIVKTHTWSSARRSQLRQYAPVYFRQKILEAETINANAVDIGLSDIETGMSYKVICEQMGKKQWYPCLRSEENLMDPTKNKFTFTYKHPTFTQEVMKIAKNVSSANRRLPATVLKSVGGVALSENPQ